MSHRTQKIGAVIQQELSMILQREMSHKCGLVNINRVDVSPDLANAKVMYGHFGTPEEKVEFEAFIERALRSLQHMLTQSLRSMRRVPRLTFVHDTSTEYSFKISQMLDELKSEKKGE
ncbi:30S ribosome-binding factor RbfA [Chrysiogenes arsenatis]|uniref:30S ribosome-binding factor RbfA n=1 Tax=Chrysiogenes arsenatis TaxID=309797 RepID=UPI0004144552|nr:30S ribosome-binding factor RbfA [Chrysiogenes arsenatis]